MSTELKEAPSETVQSTQTAPASDTSIGLSLADVLDSALGAEKTSQEPVVSKAEPAVKSETGGENKAETSQPKQDKIPSSVFDQLGKIGLDPVKDEKSKNDKPEVKADTGKLAEAEEEKLPENTPAAAQTAFAKLSRELRDAKTKLKEFEAKVADRTEAVEKKGGDVETDSQLKTLQAKLEQFQKEREELEGELRVSRIESTREYKATIGEPTKEAVSKISEIAKVYEIKPASLLEAANEPDGAKRRVLLKELTSQMDAADALDVRHKVDELVQLNNKRDEMLKESKSTLEALAKAEEEQEKAERAKYDAEAKKAFGEVWSKFQEQLPILHKVDGNESWNKTIDEIRTMAERLDSEPLDHRQRAALTYQAVSLPVVVEVFKDYVSKTNQEITKLKSNLEEYRKATPSAGSGRPVEKSERSDPNLGFLEAIDLAR